MAFLASLGPRSLVSKFQTRIKDEPLDELPTGSRRSVSTQLVGFVESYDHTWSNNVTRAALAANLSKSRLIKKHHIVQWHGVRPICVYLSIVLLRPDR